MHQTFDSRLKSDFIDKATLFRAFIQSILHTKEICEEIESVEKSKHLGFFWLSELRR